MPPSLPAIYERLVELSFFDGSERRPFIAEALKLAEGLINEGRGLIVSAPPGIGKTALPITLFLASLTKPTLYARVVHVLPLRSIIDDVAMRVDRGLSRLGVRLEGEAVAKQYGLAHGSPFLTAGYVATTLDTFSLSFLKLPVEELWKIREGERELYGHYELPRSNIYMGVAFFDEAHLALEGALANRLERASSTLATFMAHLGRCGIPFIAASATLPLKILDSLAKCLRQVGANVEVLSYASYVKRSPDGFYDSEASKKFSKLGPGVVEASSDEGILELADEAPGRVAIVVNTVKRAVKLHEMLRGSLLLHSRFTPSDRRLKLNALRSARRVITTQVVEAGVDVSFDSVVTELAPMSSMIQRFGRLARGPSRDEGCWAVFYDDEGLRGCGVYDDVMVKASLETLLKALSGGAINWHLPTSIDGSFKGYEDLLNDTWSQLKVIIGLDASLTEILENPSLSSHEVLKFLEQLGSLVREDALCTIYVGPPPRSYAELRSSLNEKGIPVSLDFAFRFAVGASRSGYDVEVVKLAPQGRLEAEAFRGDMKYSSFRLDVLRGRVVAVSIPSELYDGGVDGVGLKLISPDNGM